MSGQAKDTTAEEVVASVRLTRSDRDLLRALAKSQHRTLSGELRRLIELHLADERSEAA